VTLRGAFLVAQAACAALALARLSRGRRRRPPLSARGPAPPGGVSVVVPARDEAERLGPCLDGLRQDPDVDEVIVVVDEDDPSPTAQVARAGGARVLTVPPPPPGFIGKPWALQRGAEAAERQWLVTLDADTRPRPGLARALVAALDDADLVTAGTRFICETAGERLLHPAMLATLVYRFGPVGAEEGPSPRRAVGNGQCLAVRRDPFLAAGGFDRARGYMTDEIALIRSLSEGGWRVRFLDGADLVSVDMHASAREVWREWGRSLSMGDVTHPALQALDLAVLWLAMTLPLPRVLLRRATPLDWVLAGVRLALLGALGRVYERRGPPFWLSPLADPVAVARLTLSTVRPVRTWRGRTYT
jgi:dolichol-phosphate mannosyltransferase